MKVLIIEDAPEIVESVSLAFRIRWPEAKVVAAGLGEKGIEMAETEKPDAVILDLGLPDISGYDVLKEIRLFSDVPVIILTVRGDEADIVKGLEWGADDYIVKPFRQLELLSRIRALLRRQSGEGESVLVCGNLSFNPVTSELIFNGKNIGITPTESRILHELIKNPGQVVPHAALAEAIWGDDYPGAADSLKVYVRRLREKLESDSSNPKLILTKPGVGYMLVKPE